MGVIAINTVVAENEVAVLRDFQFVKGIVGRVRDIWFVTPGAINIYCLILDLYRVAGQGDNALNIVVSLIIWRLKYDYIASFWLVKPIDDFAD